MKTAVLKWQLSPVFWFQDLSSGFHYRPGPPSFPQLAGAARALCSLPIYISRVAVSILELGFPNLNMIFQFHTNSSGTCNKSEMLEK